MKKAISIILLCFSLALPVFARGHSKKSKSMVRPYVVRPNTVRPNVVRPNTVRPNIIQPYTTQPARAANATAVCKDGTLSHGQHRQDTCSHHGGVRTWNWAPPGPLK